MSFDDFNRGLGMSPQPASLTPLGGSAASGSGSTPPSRGGAPGPVANDDVGVAQYMKLRERIKSTMFAISANISSIERMVAHIGTVKDTQEMRQKLERLTHDTQALIKKTTEDLKQFSMLPAHSESDGRIRRLEQQKLSQNFRDVLGAFQRLQRRSAEKSREHVARAKEQTSHLEHGDDADGDNGDEEKGSLIQHERRRQQELVRLDHEIEYNEAVIADREDSIVQIEHAIHEVNEIFHDLGALVSEQQGMIDNIESNIDTAASRTGDATLELQTASRHQRSAGKKMCILLAIFLIIVVILVAVILSQR